MVLHLTSVKKRLRATLKWATGLDFPGAATSPTFSTLGINCMFFRAWHRLRVFPQFWHQLHVFPRLAPVACFQALGVGCMFLRVHQLLFVFPRISSAGRAQSAEREVSNSNPGQTNTHGLKITENEGAAFAITPGAND